MTNTISIQNWTITNGNSPFSSFCGIINLLGGDGIFNIQTVAKKTIEGLLSHYKFQMDFEFVTIDYFNDKTLNIFFDDILVGAFQMPMSTANYTKIKYETISGSLEDGYFSFENYSKYGYMLMDSGNLCAGSDDENFYLFKIIAEHNLSSINIAFKITGSSLQGTWGMKRFSYYVWSKAITTTCLPSCTTCNDLNCHYCGGAYLMQDDVCVTSCLANYKYDSGNKKCFSCHSSCLDCTDEDPDSCLSCNTNYFLSGTSCLRSCPIGFFFDANNQECKACSPTCFTCNGLNSNNCIRCNNQLLFSSGSCVVDCPLSQFLEVSTSLCKNCDIICQTCNGPFSDNCTSCMSGKYYSKGNCVINCPSNQFLKILNNSCADCDISCLTCKGLLSNECDSCHLSALFSNGNCVSSCSSNQFLNVSNSSCTDCDLTCQTCNGPLLNNCTSCPSNSFSYQSSCVSHCPTNYYANTFTNECVTCLQGYYFEISNFSCSLCDSSCLTCNDSLSTNCTSCFSSRFLFNSECILQCPSHYYYDSTNNSCFLCDISCLECNGSFQNNCLSCYSDFKFQKNVCLHAVCAFNEFWDKSDLICRNCSQFCKSCFGSQPINCLSCLDGFVQKSNQCIQSQNVSLSVTVIENPFRFILSFSNETMLFSNLFFENLNNSLTINISNFNKNLFNYSFERINQSNYSLNITFFDNLYADFSYLDIYLNNTIDDTLNLINNSFQILLNSYALCQGEDYYYENGSCLLKTIIDYNWMYTTKFNFIKLVFDVIKENKTENSSDVKLISDSLYPIIVEGVQNRILYVSATNNENISYSFQINTDSVIIIFNYTNSNFVKHRVILYQNASKWFELKNSQKTRLVKKKLTITIINEYISSDQIQMLENTKVLSEKGEIAATALTYLAYASSTKSTFAIRGILLTNLIQMLKYLTIMYPSNAKIIFLPESENHYFVNGDVYSVKPIDLLLNGLPQNFLSYNVSLYLLNNILDEYIFIFIILVFGSIFNLSNCQNVKIYQRIFNFIKSNFVWNVIIMILFSKYMKTVFFVFISLRFGFFFDKINTMFSLCFLIYINFIPLHYLKIIFILNQLEAIGLKKTFNFNVPKNNSIAASIYSNEIQKKSKFSDGTTNSFPDSESKSKKIIQWHEFTEYSTPYLKTPDNNFNDPSNLKSCDSSPNKFAHNLIKRKENIDTSSPTSMQSRSPKKKKIVAFYDLKKKEMEKNYQPSLINNSNNRILTNNSSNKISQFFGKVCLTYFLKVHDLIYKIKDEKAYARKYAVFKKELRENVGLHQYCFIIDLIRYFTIPFIIILLYGFPFIQMTILCMINLLFFALIVLEKPFKTKIRNYFSIFNEICINIAMLATFLLSILDLNENWNIDLRINLGWLLTFSYIILLSSLIFYSFLLIVSKLFLLFRRFRPKNKNKIFDRK